MATVPADIIEIEPETGEVIQDVDAVTAAAAQDEFEAEDSLL